MKFYYRISDNSYQKQKLPGADKFVCLENFLNCFKSDVTIIADRCQLTTLDKLNNFKLFSKEFNVVETDLGNAGSLHYALDLALKECHDGEIVYFCEDDYLHLPNSQQLLREGSLIADYFTLYDHPDKYTNLYDMGEVSKVVRTNSSHWRYTISTCMTFGVKISALKEDIEIFKKHIGVVSGQAEHPVDHDIFCELKEKGRKLAVCIPGTACHVDLTFSGLVGNVLLEPWAIDYMINKKIDMLELVQTKIKQEEMKEFLEIKYAIWGKKGWQKLISLDALLENCK